MFNKFRQFHIVGISALFFVLLHAIPTFAATTTYNFSGTFNGFSGTGMCTDFLADKYGPISVPVDGTATITINSYSGNETAAAYLVSTSDVDTSVGGKEAYYGFEPSITVPITAGTYNLIVCDDVKVPYGSTYSVTLTVPAGSTSGETVVYPPDDRVNWQFGDLNAVVYRHEDDGVVVYCHVDGESWVGMHISQEVVDNANPASQSDPVLSVNENGCNAAFYILDSGEFQINIWTYEGKLYEIIADNIEFYEETMRYVDPNE